MSTRSGSASSSAQLGCRQFESVPGVLAGIRESEQGRSQLLFDCLYRHFFGPVKTYILHHGGTEDDAWDVFQEYVAELLQQINEQNVSFAGYEGPFGAVLMRAVKSLWVVRFRKKEYKTTTIGLPDEAWALPGDWDTEAFLHHQAQTRALEQALAELPPNQRTFVELFYQEGKSYQEIEALSGQRADSLKSNRHRIMEKLKGRFLALL